MVNVLDDISISLSCFLQAKTNKGEKPAAAKKAEPAKAAPAAAKGKVEKPKAEAAKPAAAAKNVKKAPEAAKEVKAAATKAAPVKKDAKAAAPAKKDAKAAAPAKDAPKKDTKAPAAKPAAAAPAKKAEPAKTDKPVAEKPQKAVAAKPAAAKPKKSVTAAAAAATGKVGKKTVLRGKGLKKKKVSLRYAIDCTNIAEDNILDVVDFVSNPRHKFRLVTIVILNNSCVNHSLLFGNDKMKIGLYNHFKFCLYMTLKKGQRSAVLNEQIFDIKLSTLYALEEGLWMQHNGVAFDCQNWVWPEVQPYVNYIKSCYVNRQVVGPGSRSLAPASA